jgi:hypothetical protein
MYTQCLADEAAGPIVALCNNILSIDPNSKGALQTLIQVAWHRGEYTEVEALADNLIEQDPSRSEWRYFRGFSRLVRGASQEARADLITAYLTCKNEDLCEPIRAAILSAEALDGDPLPPAAYVAA